MRSKFISLIALTAIMVLAAEVSVAQISPLNFESKKKVTKNIQIRKDDILKLQRRSAAPESFWLNYGTTMDYINSGTAELNQNYLFPDSTVLGDFGGTFSSVWLHNIGNVFDAYSPHYNTSDGQKYTTGFTVDSMGINYAYVRNHPDTTIVDTLILELYTNATASNLLDYYFYQHPGWPQYDTVSYKQQKYSYTSNSANAGGKTTFKIPLSSADTAVTFFRMKYWDTDTFLVKAGKLAACAIKFKPGYTYNVGDTLDVNRNYFLFTSYEEFGAGTYPTYTPGDRNVSCIIPTDVRYNINTNGWNGFYIPTLAYYEQYSLEHHLIFYKITFTGDYGVSSIETPANGSAVNGGDQTSVKIYIKNYGGIANDATGSLKFSYQANNEPIVTETVNFSAAVGDSMAYTFTKKYKTTTEGTINFCSWFNGADLDNTNDKKCISFTVTNPSTNDDSGILSFIGPASDTILVSGGSDTIDVIVTIKNYSSSEFLNSCDVGYQVSGSNPIYAIASGLNLAPGSQANYTFVNKLILTASTTITLKSWTTGPNGKPDDNKNNDTMTTTIYVGGLGISDQLINTGFILENLYPNPANTSFVNISYTLMESGNVEIAIYDMVGRKVKAHRFQKVSKGSYQTIIDINDLPAGFYICTMKSGNFVASKKLNIIR